MMKNETMTNYAPSISRTVSWKISLYEVIPHKEPESALRIGSH